MLRISQLKLPVGHTQEDLARAVRKLLKCSKTPKIIIVRRSIDARKKPELYFNYTLNIETENQAAIYRKCNRKFVSVWEETPYMFPVDHYQGKTRPVVIGMGPAGLFCGYMLAAAGFRPVLLERGASVAKRTEDVHAFWKSGRLNPESNVQFGEGGAGAFSDGKLNTLVKDKNGRNHKVLSLLVEHGAPEEILYDHKPHIGTDLLGNIVVNLRNSILKMGGEVHFHSKVTDFLCRDGHVTGVMINGTTLLEAAYIVLAPGHSARDTLTTLYEKGVRMEARPFAVGMRVEHPQKLINLSQYGREEVTALGSAPYKVTAQSHSGRGVYSFCMCPGGYVVNASSESGRLAVNGMSCHARNGPNANSAIIISVTPDDYGSDHPLAGVEFQRRLEEKAFLIGGGAIPVERYGDYIRAVTGQPMSEARASVVPDDFRPCIKGKWTYAPVHEILPRHLQEAFLEGMEQFGKMIKGFNDLHVLVDGIESRTSSPVRILRDESLQSSLKGLFPCGEGAGYAGGITSAAMDGIRVAEEIATQIINRG